jgi:hypothetical protein
MTKHKRSSIRKWKQAIADWDESGLDIREYCQQSNIIPSSFYRWQRWLHDLNIKPEGNFKELQFSSESETSCSEFCGIEISFLPGLTIKLQRGFDISELKRTLQAFGIVSC